MPNRRSQNNSKPRRANRQLVTRADPRIMPYRLKISGVDIPRYTPAPPVMRTVRYVLVLTSAAPTNTIRYSDLAATDGLNYTGSTTPRYQQMRVISVKAWAESPNSLSVSQTPYGLVLTDVFTSFSVSDRAVTGARVSACGIMLPFYVRSILVPVTSTTSIFTVSCDTTIAASTNFAVTVDTLIEFVS